jgi:hypothetical protein
VSLDLRAAIDTFASARAELSRFEELALTLAGVPELAPAKGAVLVAKEALRLARLAVLEAGERLREAVAPKGGE